MDRLGQERYISSQQIHRPKCFSSCQLFYGNYLHALQRHLCLCILIISTSLEIEHTIIFFWLIWQYVFPEQNMCSCTNWKDKILADTKILNITRSFWVWTLEQHKMLLQYSNSNILSTPDSFREVIRYRYTIQTQLVMGPLPKYYCESKFQRVPNPATISTYTPLWTFLVSTAAI